MTQLTPLETFLVALRSATGQKAISTGSGFSACCPEHTDRSPSLSISEGSDGRCLIHCHAGCTAEAIVAAVGLRMADLMPPSSRGTNRRPRPNGKPVAVAPPIVPTEASAQRAAQAMSKRVHPEARLTDGWTYRNADGALVFCVTRYQTPGGKQYRPLRPEGKGWKFCDPPGPLPLYNLPALVAADRVNPVYIVEGEKCADVLTKLGLVATTSAHGSKSAGKSDWSPLAGRNVVIIPDHDDPGQRYAGAVAAILLKIDPNAKIKIVPMTAIWSACPSGGDVADFVEQHPGLSDGEVRKRIERAAGAVEPVTAAGGVEDDLTIPWEPFPVDYFPEPMRSFVMEGAAALGCDMAFLAPHLLAAVAAAVGNSRRIRLKESWHEPVVIWAVVVAESGTLKSPSWEMAVRPMQTRQTALFAEFKLATEQYEHDKSEYDADLSDWKKNGRKQGLPMPEPPERPTPERLVISDATAEAVAVVLSENPRGVLLARDEVSGFVNSMDGYKSVHGVDVTFWLSVHRAGAITIDRKTGKRIIHIPRSNVSICGTTQLGTLQAAFAGRYSEAGDADAMEKPAREHLEDGLAARFLMCCPPIKPKHWTEDAVSPAVADAVDRMFTRLLSLEMSETDDGQPVPVDLRMTPDGKAEWIRFYNEHAKELATLTGDMAAVYSKAECHAARLALVHHLALHAGDPTLPDDGITAESVRAGVTLSRWFCREAGRIYADIGGAGLSPEEQDRFELVRIIQQHGGRITTRDLMRSCRKYRESADVAETALSGLAEAGLGIWETVETAGRQKREFILSGAGDGDTSSLTPGKTDLLSPSPGGSTSENDTDEHGESVLNNVNTSSGQLPVKGVSSPETTSGRLLDNSEAVSQESESWSL